MHFTILGAVYQLIKLSKERSLLYYKVEAKTGDVGRRIFIKSKDTFY